MGDKAGRTVGDEAERTVGDGAGKGLWMLEQELAELAAEGLPPVEQSVPLDMPQIFCMNMLKFPPAMLETHPGCSVLLSIFCLNNGYLNNRKALSLYKLALKKKLWLQTLLLQFLVLVFLLPKCWLLIV